MPYTYSMSSWQPLCGLLSSFLVFFPIYTGSMFKGWPSYCKISEDVEAKRSNVNLPKNSCRIGVTKTKFVKFSIRYKFDFAELRLLFLESHSYLNGQAAAKPTKYECDAWSKHTISGMAPYMVLNLTFAAFYHCGHLLKKDPHWPFQ